MIVSTKDWTEQLDNHLGWAKSVSVAYEHLLDCLRDDHDGDINIVLQQMDIPQALEYLNYFKECRKDYLNGRDENDCEDYFSESDYREFFSDCGPSEDMYVSLQVEERKPTPFEVKMNLCSMKEKRLEAEHQALLEQELKELNLSERRPEFADIGWCINTLVNTHKGWK